MKSYKTYNEDEKSCFIENLVIEFNQARTNPKQYINKINEHLKFVKVKNNNSYYDSNNYPKVLLKKGKEAFNDLIYSLEKMNRMNELIIKKDIAIKMPENSEDMNNKEKIYNLVVEKKKELNGIYKYFNFHYDHGDLNAEISAILQLVDDTNSNLKRRNNILNICNKYIGISVGKMVNNRYLVYLSFAGDN